MLLSLPLVAWLVWPTPETIRSPQLPPLDRKGIIPDSTAIARLLSHRPPANFGPQNQASAFLYSSELATAGKKFFFTKHFSKNKRTSCATCHKPELGFTDGLSVADATGATKNTPSLVNTAFYGWWYWDGRVDSLSAQASGPIEHPSEHGFSRTEVIQALSSEEELRETYETAFGKIPTSVHELPEAMPCPDFTLPVRLAAFAFSTQSSDTEQIRTSFEANRLGMPPAFYLIRKFKRAGLSNPRIELCQRWGELRTQDQRDVHEVFRNVRRALAAYEERILAIAAPFDQFREQIELNLREIEQAPTAVKSFFSDSFGAAEWEGFKLFHSKAGCHMCHHGFAFTDSQFHNLGLPETSYHPWPWGRARGMQLAKNNPEACEESSRNTFVDNGCQELGKLSTENLETVGAFRTPTLRNLRKTTPYMHNGIFPTLESVIAFYQTLPGSAQIGKREGSLLPFALSQTEGANLLKFLESLESDVRSP